MDFSNLRQVGEFPTQHKQIIRAPKNPIDKSTIVSIFPKEIKERKYSIEPGTFEIPGGDFENPSILVIGSSSWFSNRGPDHPLLEIPVSSVQVAESVITGWCSGLVGCDMVDLMPGLFFVPGEVTVKDIKEKHKKKLEEFKAKQNNWYNLIIKLADSLWARSNGNPLVISDEARLAAEQLGKKDKPWLGSFKMVEMVPCIGCGTFRNPKYPICPQCKLIDPSHPMAKDLKFAV